MKKIILTVGAIFAMSVVNAQEIKYGVKAGFNSSTFTGDVAHYDVKSKAGFHVGGFVEFKITDKFSVQPELLYSAQGAKLKFSTADEFSFTTEKQDIKLGYLNIPIIAKYYVIPGLSIEAGPQVGFLLSAKNEFSYDYYITEAYSSSGEDDIKDDSKSIDFGFNFGAGYEFTENVFVQGRYNLGLTSISEETTGESDPKNGVLQISVGYKF